MENNKTDENQIEIENNHRQWLLSRQGLRYLFAKKEKDVNQAWKLDYQDNKYDENINLIEIKADEAVIEFDEKNIEDVKNKLPEIRKSTQEQRLKWTNEVIDNLEKESISYIMYEHGGKSPHIHINLSRKAIKEEKEGIVKYYIPKESVNFVDTSLCGVHLISVPFAKHWKYGTIKRLVKEKNGSNINVDDEKYKTIINNNDAISNNLSGSGITAEIVSKVKISELAVARGARKGSGTPNYHCCFHIDDTPSLSLNDERGLFRCFAGSCGRKGNIVDFVAETDKISKEEAIKKLKEIAGIKYNKTKEEATKKSKEKEGYKILSEEEQTENKKHTFDKAINIFTDKLDLAKRFIEIQPVYYERKGQFWVWDFENYCWIERDETDILNSITRHTNIDTVDSKEKSEILEALKQTGRLNKPADIKPTWVQFKDKIYDIETGEILEATSRYFVANPINWKVGDSEETPIIDKLIKSWVKEEDVNKLYEIIAFTTVPKLFIHSFFFLYSPPGMGKSTFVNLLLKFIGKHNQTATSIDRINTNTRFETYYWYKKLLITLPEVSNINDLKNSGLINQATGEDVINAEIKNGGSFRFVSYGKWISPTNKLLKVDAEDGFGRRVRTIKFITRFEKERDVLEEIPDWEFENLAKKCLRIAKDLWSNRQFTGDVSISERMKNYQDESKTPLEKFIDKYCDITDVEAKIPFDKFYAKFVRLSGQKESKINVSKHLRKNIGFEVKIHNYYEEKLNVDGQKVREWTSGTLIFGIKWKEEQNK